MAPFISVIINKIYLFYVLLPHDVHIFAVAANDTLGLRRSITGYSDDIYICLTMYKCYFDGCVPPPPEDDIIPSSVRVDGCVRANGANGVRWRENPDNPQEVISVIESAEGNETRSLE